MSVRTRAVVPSRSPSHPSAGSVAQNSGPSRGAATVRNGLGADDAEAFGLAGRAARLLGDPEITPQAAGADLALAAAREQLETRIAEHGGTLDRDVLLEACHLLDQIETEQREREAVTLSARVAEVARIQRATDELREMGPTEVVERAPELLCSSCSLGRGMISSVVGSMWLPRQLSVVPGVQSADHVAEFLEFLRSARIPLVHTLIEAELVRRRVPALIDDAERDERTFKEIVRAGRTSSYVVAPVMSRGRAIGFFHGDRPLGSSRVTEVDRDRVAAFASCFGVLHEHALLRARLAEQRRRATAAFADADAMLEALETSVVRLDDAVRSAAEVVDPRAPSPQGLTAQRVQDLLTSREREVLALMTEGATNSRIAEHLVIAEGTVKSHVKNILRKLRAPTRSAAVARYAQLTRRAGQPA